MKVYAVINAKGGSAKTTSSVSLAGALAETGRPVLLVDLDPQASATRWLVGSPGHGDAPYRILEGSLPLSEAVVQAAHGIDLLPATSSLEQAARTLATEAGADSCLAAALRGAAPLRHDVVLIDCPPAAGFLSSNALVAADGIVIPVAASHLSLDGLARLLSTARRLEARLGRPVPVVAILVCRVDRRTRQAPEVAAHVRAFAEEHLSGTVVFEIRENVTLSDAFRARLPITAFAPRSTGAEDYRAAARVLLPGR